MNESDLYRPPMGRFNHSDIKIYGTIGDDFELMLMNRAVFHTAEERQSMKIASFSFAIALLPREQQRCKHI